MRMTRVSHAGHTSWAIQTPEGLRPLGVEKVRAAMLGDKSIPQSRTSEVLEQEDVALIPPLLPEASVYCIGLNYKSHVEEVARDLPPQPSVFVRVHGSLVGHGQSMVRPRVSEHFDYEGEVAVVIGRPARHVSEEHAWSHVAGLTCFNDGSVRDFQKHSVTAGKNFEASGACGPFIVTLDEVAEREKLVLTTRLNGAVVQRSDTSMLIYSVPRILSYLSSIVELRTGDIVATGTPAGVGARRTPPLWMKHGDRIEVEIDGVGQLSNGIVDERGAT
jgi:2-keto-4-pentenoate hydratase/2-oxohepta-3-ene-1,7-dioic acid hydratase in catechol pathway